MTAMELPLWMPGGGSGIPTGLLLSEARCRKYEPVIIREKV